jgi:ribosomal protein S12 methylthiotransferase
MSLQRRISRLANKRLIGRELPVLIEGPSKETDLLWEARLSTQAPEIDGVCYINDLGGSQARPGEIRSFRVTEAHDYDLIGELIDAPEQSYITAKQHLNPFPILPSNTPTAARLVR